MQVDGDVDSTYLHRSPTTPEHQASAAASPRPIPLTTNCRPEAPGGGGLVGVLGPAESPPPYLPPMPSPPYPPPPPQPPPLPPPYLQGRGGRLRAIYGFPHHR